MSEREEITSEEITSEEITSEEITSEEIEIDYYYDFDSYIDMLNE